MQWRVGTIQAHHMTLIKSLALQSPSRRPLMTTKIKFAIAGFDTFFFLFLTGTGQFLTEPKSNNKLNQKGEGRGDLLLHPLLQCSDDNETYCRTSCTRYFAVWYQFYQYQFLRDKRVPAKALMVFFSCLITNPSLWQIKY